MIARIWKGTTREADKDTYFEYLQKTGLKEYAAIPGNRGVWTLRSVHDGKAERADLGPRGRDVPLDEVVRRPAVAEALVLGVDLEQTDEGSVVIREAPEQVDHCNQLVRGEGTQYDL